MSEEGERKEREIESEVCGRGGPVMDTPERKQITTPISKFEDSPVFNYINNLSPIKTVRSIRISQTFNSFNFASVPSIFTSPHINSIKESRFLRRHQLSDPSKPEFSSENGNEVGSSDGLIVASHNPGDQHEHFNPVNSVGEASAEPTTNCRKLPIEVSKTLSYECGSPNCSATPCRGTETSSGLELACTSASIVQFAQDVSERSPCGSGMNLEGANQIEQNKETGCDWESLISDAADLLIFDSPNEMQALNGSFHKPLDARLCAELINDANEDLHKTQTVFSDAVQQHELEIPSHAEDGHLKGMGATGDILACSSLNESMSTEPSEQIDNDALSNIHRGMRRRCLVFEMTEARRKHLGDGSTSGSTMISQSEVNIVSNDKQLVPAKPGNDSSRCILPGIGLHLNALARTSKDYNDVSHETLASGRQLINDCSSIASFPSLTSSQELNKSLAVISEETNVDPADNAALIAEEASQVSGDIPGEEFSQISPKKKRRRSENAGEIEGCKRCNCKKSKCLKLYCECFAAGVYCVEPCSCQDCFNKPIHEDTVLATRKQIESRNPLAFAPKVIRTSDFASDIGDESSRTPASARHKRGCNCKKSGCLKKYCECYQGGVGCSINCRCEGCKNVFGRKDGSTLIGPEAEMEEEETETCDKTVDRNLDKTVLHNNAEHNLDSSFLATPLQGVRASIQLPFLSKSRPPRSSLLSIGSSSGSCGGQRFGKPSFLPPQPKFDKRLQTVQEDEMPEILLGNCSPNSGIKSSPNSKRVSPPHCGIGSSPGLGSSRKLILQSIPSFPSLTPKH